MHINDVRRVVAGLDEDRYSEFLALVVGRFREVVTDHGSGHLFSTDAKGLWEAYLDSAPYGQRKVRDCTACRHFIERYGDLAIIHPDGQTSSAIWPNAGAPPAYFDAAYELNRLVCKASITGVFLSADRVLGTPHGPKTGTPWTHVSVHVPESAQWRGHALTAGQRMAEKREEWDMLVRGLAEFPTDVVRRAHALLSSGQLYRSEKCQGVAKWLVDLHDRLDGVRGKRRENIIWLAVAGAPAGFCHVRSSMIGTLLEDIVAGLPFETLRNRFNEKMDPLHYQRPQAAPSVGNIAAAEKVVAKLETAGALARRFARMGDVVASWRPRWKLPTAPGVGVFGHLATKRRAQPAAIDTEASPQVMTWDKFSRTVLPTAERIECLVPHGKAPYAAMVTAQNAEAPPILQWDHPDRRCQVSWYLYGHEFDWIDRGQRAEHWNLRSGAWTEVTAAVLNPSTWYGPGHVHHGTFVLLALKGAYDTLHTAGGGFFVESLKSDYHAVRKTLEAYAKRASIADQREAEVCGLFLQQGAKQSWNVRLRVTSGGIVSHYTLDRWD